MMSEKKSFALRIDSETMKAIEKWADDEFRSVNGQIEWMLSNSTGNGDSESTSCSNSSNTRTSV